MSLLDSLQRVRHCISIETLQKKLYCIRRNAEALLVFFDCFMRHVCQLRMHRLAGVAISPVCPRRLHQPTPSTDSTDRMTCLLTITCLWQTHQVREGAVTHLPGELCLCTVRTPYPALSHPQLFKSPRYGGRLSYVGWYRRRLYSRKWTHCQVQLWSEWTYDGLEVIKS
jgi:hypothetical protein